jgi:hypothetical protein
MNTPLSDRSNEVIAREILKPLEERLAKGDEVLHKLDELIHEAEQKSKPVLDPRAVKCASADF